MIKGKLIVLEAPDAAGKTTQVKHLTQYLKGKGFDVINVREPGGTQVGEMVRDILLHVDMDPVTELLLFTASRMQLIAEVIKPALDAGKVVICDRFLDSTRAYQGHGRGLLNEVNLVEPLVTNIVNSDYVIFIEITIEESLKRLQKRKQQDGQELDRLDSLELETKKKIFDGYIQAAEHRENSVKLDGMQSIETVTQDIYDWVDNCFIPQNQDLIKKD